MTLQEIIDKLTSGIRNGNLDPDEPLYFRDYEVSDEAMEAGSDGWAEVDEILVAGGVARLLPEERY